MIKNARSASIVAILLIALRSAMADDAPIKLLCSFEPEEMLHLMGKDAKITPSENLLKSKSPATPVSGLLVGKGDTWDLKLVKSHASDGEYSLLKTASPYGKRGDRDDRMGVMNPYVRLFGMDWVRNVIQFTDWSGYDYLWLDVTAPDADSIPWIFIEDSHTFGPYARYQIAKGKSVTLSLPLARVVTWSKEHGEGEFNLADVRSIFMMDEANESVAIYVDNLRLARTAAPKPANLIDPVEYIGADMGMLADSQRIPPLPKRDFPRQTGSVEQLGPLSLPEFDWGRGCAANGAFGEGGDSGTANLRAVAAYDNSRIAVVLSSSLVFATFDGGKTWGGADGKSQQPFRLPASHGHGGEGAGYYNGDLFILDRHMCNGGGGINRLDILPVFFQGDHWENGPRVILDHHCRGCPGAYPILFQCQSGRVWAFWDAPRLMPLTGPRYRCCAKYSDDFGINWRSPGSPNQIVFVPGEIAAPYKDQVAVFGDEGEWQFFDGEIFQNGMAMPNLRGGRIRSVAGTSSGALAAGILSAGKSPGLTVATLGEGKWNLEILDDGSTGSVNSLSLTASGEKLFCFWVRKEIHDGKDSFPLLYSVWNAKPGWSKPIEIARENEDVHRVITPVVSPPDYVPVFWDKRAPSKGKTWKEDYPWVRFARVPSDKTWKPTTTHSTE